MQIASLAGALELVTVGAVTFSPGLCSALIMITYALSVFPLGILLWLAFEQRRGETAMFWMIVIWGIAVFVVSFDCFLGG